MQTNPHIEAFLARFPVPMDIWLTEAVAENYAGIIESMMAGGARVSLVGDPAQVQRPGILVLAPGDLAPDAPDVVRLTAERLLPGRPILVGGTRDRDVLLRALNDWRVVRVVPTDDDGPVLRSLLMDSLAKAQEGLMLGVTIHRATLELRKETENLRAVITQLQAAQGALLHTERLSALGRITGGLIAEIRLRLKTIHEFGELAREHCSEDLHALVELALDGISAATSLLDEMHAYAEEREQTYALVPLPLDDLVARAVEFTRFDRLARRRQLEVNLMSNAIVAADKHRIYQVLLNLLRNAFHATEEGTLITVSTDRDGDVASLTVEDRGCGMSSETASRVFEPFFSTKGESGLGLGLAVARATIERHGGRIHCWSKPGVGTRFTIELPAHAG